MRRIWLVGRRSAGRRPGGDQLQMDEVAELLRGSWDVQQGPPQPQPGDTVAFFNIQRWPDWGELFERCDGVRRLIVPLYHPLGRYHREGRQGLSRAAAAVVRDPLRFAALRWGKGDLRDGAARLLGAADRVLLAHPREAELLREAFDVSFRDTAILPAAVPAELPATEVTPPFAGDFLLCSGRIEPLKNPLGVLQAARELDLPLAFAGVLPGFRHTGYVRRFLTELGDAVLLGELPPAELRALMARARVHVLASWTELMGRVSLEAALAGCAVVAPQAGFLPDWIGEVEGLWLVPPGDAVALREAIDSAWQAGRPGPELAGRVRDRLTWGAVEATVLEAFAP